MMNNKIPPATRNEPNEMPKPRNIASPNNAKKATVINTVAEAMMAIVLMDHLLRHRGQNADVRVSTPVLGQL